MKVTKNGKKLGSMDDASIGEFPPSHPPPTPRVNARSGTGRTIPEQAMNEASIAPMDNLINRITAERLWTNATFVLPTPRLTPSEERND